MSSSTQTVSGLRPEAAAKVERRDEAKVKHERPEDAGIKPPARILDHVPRPKGVISPRAQQYFYVAIAVVIVLVSMFSSGRARKPQTAETRALPPVAETNDRKLADFASEMASEQKAAASRGRARLQPQAGPLPNPTVTRPEELMAQPMASRGPQPFSAGTRGDDAREYSGAGAGIREEDPLVAKERERVYNSRFASNLAFARDRNPGEVAAAAETAEPTQMAALVRPATQDESPSLQQRGGNKKSSNVEVNSATGQPYVLFEGTTIEATLVNRLDGEFAGPIKVMVANSVYSHDRQHVLIPEGTTILGEVKPVEGMGQRRLAVAFHRLLMPDGYSVDLDQFKGLSEDGAMGLSDKVNNHYVQIFGSSVALGVIAGAAQSSVGTAGLYQSGADAYRQGVAASVSQSSAHVLDKFLNINPTLTIHEGQRIKVYLTQDLLLPAYENHTVPPNI